MIELAVILLIVVIVPLALWKLITSKTEKRQIMDRQTAERAVRADLSEHEGRERRIEREQNDQ